MAKIKQGILGGFKGKVGSVVGQRINGEWIMKAYQGDVKNPKSTAQNYYRSIFSKAAGILKSTCPLDWSFLKSAKIEAGSNARTEAFRYVYAFKRFEVAEGGVWQYEPKVEATGIVPTIPLTLDYAGAGQCGIALGTAADAAAPGEKFFGFDFSRVSSNMVTDFLAAENVSLKIWFIDRNGEFAHTSEFVLQPTIGDDSIPYSQLPNCGVFGTSDEVGARVFTKVTNVSELPALGNEYFTQNNYPKKLLWSIEGVTESGLPRVFGVGVKETSIRISQ